MKQKLEFDIHETVTVREEALKGVLLTFNPLKDVAGTPTLCDINTFNKVGIDIILKRANGNQVILFEGYLDDLLIALYGQTTRYEIAKTKTSVGYLVNLDLSPYAIGLTGKDEFVVKLKADKTAFVSTTIGLGSSIMFETVPALRGTAFVPQVRYKNIGNGNQEIDMDLGDNIFKIVAGLDFTATYIASQKAKVESGVLTASGNFEKVFTETLLLSENYHYFTGNPESPVEDLVILWEKRPVNNVKLRAKLTAAADKDAKVLCVCEVPAH